MAPAAPAALPAAGSLSAAQLGSFLVYIPLRSQSTARVTHVTHEGSALARRPGGGRAGAGGGGGGVAQAVGRFGTPLLAIESSLVLWLVLQFEALLESEGARSPKRRARFWQRPSRGVPPASLHRLWFYGAHCPHSDGVRASARAGQPPGRRQRGGRQ